MELFFLKNKAFLSGYFNGIYRTAKKYLLIFLAVFSCIPGYAQTIRGKIADRSGNAVIGATIWIGDTQKGTVSDTDGIFEIQEINPGKYELMVSALGFGKKTVPVSVITDEDIRLDIVLDDDTRILDEVVITGKSNATLIREQAYAVEVVEAKGFKNLSTNANDILGRISGVNIRQSGGVGSDFTLSLNGLSGNQVRIFLDGVPMDYFGSSLSLNNFSANIIDRIEVYKGVVPIHLSSDALGGAVNVTTGNKGHSYLDASYSFGSFNTHLASLNAQYRVPKSGFTTRFKSFLNFAENNYRVPVRLINFDTGKEDDQPTWVRRFHDDYRSRMGWVEFGFTGTDFADQLMAGIIFSNKYNELQQPVNAIGQAKIPYGEVANEEEKIIANFTFNKRRLFTERLSFNSYLVAVFAESLARDTASVRYDWFGNRYSKIDNTTGEIENRKTLLTLGTENVLANANAEYALGLQNSITLNYSLNHLTLQGADPFKRENNTQFSHPNRVTKQVFAASYTHTLLREKLKTTVFAKYYDYDMESIETDYGGDGTHPFTSDRSNLGMGISATYVWNNWQIKASFENATRFPEVIELFGDGLNTVPSPGVTPEQSLNYNLGFLYNRSAGKHDIMLSMNAFIRDAGDFIIPVIQGLKVHHMNNGEVLSKGVDLGMGYNYHHRWFFTINGTYLDLRDNNRWRNGQTGVENALFKARLPNVPYLFGNMSLSYRNGHLFAAGDSYAISLSQNYVHDFFYRWEVLASSNKGMVPDQFTTNLEFVYSYPGERYNASLAIVNLWNAEVYDNFQQLRPGRNFNLKLRYFFNKSVQ